MTNNEIMQKLEEDIRLRGLSISTLKEYTDSAKVFLRYINNKNPEGFLFLTKSGTPIKGRNVQDIFNKVATKAGFPNSFSPHTLYE